MKKKWMIFSVVLLFLIGAGIGVYMGTPSISKNKREQAVSVQSVAVITGYAKEEALRDRYLGILSQEDAVVVYLDDGREKGGFLVAAGDHVNTGTVLAVYDNSGLLLEKEQLELDMEQMELTLDNLYLQIRTLKNDREQASGSDREGYNLQILNIQSQAEQSEYDLKLKERELETLEKKLEEDQIVSPCEGIVTEIDENAGSISILAEGAYELSFTVSEEELERFQTGMTLYITDRDGKNSCEGTVSRIEAGNPQTGDGEKKTRYPVCAVLEYAEGFLNGQHVYAEIAGEEEQETENAFLLLPEGYIEEEEEKPWVWAVGENGTLQKRQITLGAYNDRNHAYEVTGGLSMTDYLAWPAASLKEGMPADFGS